MYVDDGNALFGVSQLIGMGSASANGVNDAAFSGALSNMRPLTDTFSMTLRVVIEHGDGIANTSFDFAASTLRASTLRVPEPATPLLLAGAMMLFAFAARRPPSRTA